MKRKYRHRVVKAISLALCEYWITDISDWWKHFYAKSRSISASGAAGRLADRNGKAFVPRFTLSRDKPYVVVTKTCQNTPICKCLFTFRIPNNGQQLAHFNERGYSLLLWGVFATAEPERLVLIPAKMTQSNFPWNSPSAVRGPFKEENGQPQIFISRLWWNWLLWVARKPAWHGDFTQSVGFRFSAEVSFLSNLIFQSELFNNTDGVFISCLMFWWQTMIFNKSTSGALPSRKDAKC